ENLQITEVDSGVTYVTGGAFPVQILESKKLSAETNLYLQHLRKNWDKNDFNKIVQWFEQTGQFDPKNIYLSRLFEANEKITKGDAESMTYLEKTVTNAIEERANTDEVFRKQMLNKLGGEDQKETTLKLLKKGLSIQDIAEVFNKPIEWVENLAKAHQPSNT
ncbi:MAG: hypothetical protein FWG68_07435, partial [Defluviitaleaceae bacterium]|nr:hypothetical protein [Defluviitaleaceae bacterium]